jgi:hypothetical protein
METKTRRVRIVQDCDADSPRTWDNMGVMACWHSRYTLGDEQPKVDSGEWLRDLAVEACPRLGEIIEYWENEGWDWLQSKLGTYSEADQAIIPHLDDLIGRVLVKHFVILPLYLYDHSGITMNVGGFSCPWDSGQVGYIVCSLSKALECWLLSEGDWDTEVEYTDGPVTLREGTTRNLKCEVETYAQFLEGNVYGFIVEECEECDCCGHAEWEHVDSCFGFYGYDPEENGMADHLDDDLLEMAKDAEPEYRRY